jgi:hypothetical protein
MNIYFIKTICRLEGKSCVWNSQIELAGYCPETDNGCSASGHPKGSVIRKCLESGEIKTRICQARRHFRAINGGAGRLGTIVASTFPEVTHEHGSNH